MAESLAATVADLRTELDDASVQALLDRLEIRPVLTAHPTEARRRAVVEALRRIGHALDALDDPRLAAGDHADAERRLAEEVSLLWRTAQLRQRRPAPLDEVRSVMAIFDDSLFTLVPLVYRALERAAGRAPERPLLAWGSWVGGDRDGNPHVTHEVTEETVAIQADHVLRGLEAATRRIGRSLTVSIDSTPASAPVLAMIDRSAAMLGAAAEPVRAGSPGEPHREAVLLAAERLAATRLGEPGRYASAAEFLDEVRIVRDSLRAAGACRLADGELQHLDWQAQTFGFHLASLEVRQHASVIATAVADLESGRAGEWSERTVELLATLRTMASIQARHGTGACRRFVVSFTRSAADITGVFTLARAATADPFEVDVIPLFESRADLAAAVGVLDELLGVPAWREWLDHRGRRLEVMLGYSDATKDAGYLAANLALHRAQAALVEWARRNRVELTLFHGRGGAVGRGGGPAGRAIRSQAPGSLDGRFKVTEQGEVIFARYGNQAIALRHLEQVASAVLVASTAAHERRLETVERRYAHDADVMAEAAEAAYRGLVEAPGFAEFFARVTPIEEIGQLAIGSRPARRERGAPRELEDLRAIPWVFAWTQNRCNLPGWFGLGTGLQAVVDRHGLEHLRRMAEEWPFLASIVDNAEMSLAKADPMIAGLYLERGERPDLVDVIREEYRLTRRLVLAITGRDRLLAGHPILRLAVDLRNPYVDALSLLQLRFLRELPGATAERADQLSALVRLTVGGVAAGLQNTG